MRFWQRRLTSPAAKVNSCAAKTHYAFYATLVAALTRKRLAGFRSSKISAIAKTLGNNKKWHSSVSAYSSESSPNWSGNWSGGLALGSLLYKPPDFSGRRVGARTPDLCRVEATLY